MVLWGLRESRLGCVDTGVWFFMIELSSLLNVQVYDMVLAIRVRFDFFQLR